MNRSPDGDTPRLEENRFLAERYLLLDKIGEGGAAEVYRARDQRLDRIVAIKLLRRQYTNEEASRKRFLIEARTAAGLNHPNIVDIYDFGEAPDGSMFIAMQYVEGHNLKDVLQRRGRMSAGEVVAIVPQVCHALAVAHAHGLIHRDVKPQNIMIDNKGNVRLTDFGIVKALSGPELTQTGMTFGTAAYLSPEQATGEPVGPPSDIYALGCVMYEMLCGSPPFTGDNPAVVAYKQVWEQPRPLHDWAPEVLPSLEAIVMRCLNKDPNRRYPDADSLAADLASLGTAFNQPTQAVALNAATGASNYPNSAPLVVHPRAETIRPIQMPESPAPAAPVPPVKVQSTNVGNVTRRVEPARPPATSASRVQVVDATSRGRSRAWLPMAMVAVALGLGVCALASWQSNMFGIFAGASTATPTLPAVVATATQPPLTATLAPIVESTATAPPGEPTGTPAPLETETPTALPVAPTDIALPTLPPPPTVTPEPPPPPPVPTDTPEPPPDTPVPPTEPPPADTPTTEPLPLPTEPAPGGNNSVTIDGPSFSGGYTTPAGYHKRTAEWVYGQGTAFGSMTAVFNIDGDPKGPGTLTIVGVDSEDPPKTPIRLVVNGSVIYEGPDPLPNDNRNGPNAPGNWGAVSFRIGPRILHQGQNTITLTNLDPSNKINYPIFVMVDSVTIAW